MADLGDDARGFQAPNWDAPLDADACIAIIPPGATIKGLFLLPMIQQAQRMGVVLKGARERYLAFSDYPLVEHARMLVEASRAFFPDASLRIGLRKLGRAGLAAFVETTVGKVVWASVERVDAALEAVAKGYSITSPSAHVAVVDGGEGFARVKLQGVHWFLDSHHVGLFEGVMRACNANGTVMMRLDSPSAGEFLLRWAAGARDAKS